MRLGTAQWADYDFVEQNYGYKPGTLWLGRSAQQNALGYSDDRHVCLISGNRGGKGTSVIVTNLCLWPGSVVVVDPKGENASVTAVRRGGGEGEYCEGMGQPVHVLDPFRVAHLPDSYRARFNPLDALDPEDPETVDKAAMLADAIVLVREDATDPFWDDRGRDMVKALILHLVTAPEFEGRRNLVTLRRLLLSGYQEAVEALESMGEDPEPAHGLMWETVAQNGAFDGRIAAMGNSFADLFHRSAKTYESVLQVANNNTSFLDSPPMEDLVTASDFRLADLKTDPKGVSVYLSLPQRFMNTHSRWLRMMTGLILMEMETVAAQPACGHPVLVVLDEFAGMKRMQSIETGVAQMAGYGVKLFFVLQSLEQLKAVYKERWETFLDNCGLQLYFSVGDNFTREYVSKHMGDTEVIRDVRSSGTNDSRSESESESRSESRTRGGSATEGESRGSSLSRGHTESEGTNWSEGSSYSHSDSKSWGSSLGATTNISGWVAEFTRDHPLPAFFLDKTYSSSTSNSMGTSESHSHSSSRGGSRGSSESRTEGSSRTATHSESENWGTTQGASHGSTHGQTHGETSGTAETVHKRPLCAPDEIGKMFARMDDRGNPAYPGLGLALIAGQDPLPFRRVNYYEDYQFVGLFGPHPDHEFLPPVKSSVSTGGLLPFQERLGGYLSWESSVRKGQVVRAGEVLAMVNKGMSLLPDGKGAAMVLSPCAGRIVDIPVTLDTRTGTLGEMSPLSKSMPTLSVGSVEILHYAGDTQTVDPFEALAAYCKALEDEKARQAREEAQRKAQAAQAAAEKARAVRQRDEQARKSRAAALKESGLRWLKGAGAAGVLLAGDAGVSYFTHAVAVIAIGIGAAGVTGYCGWRALRRFAEKREIENPQPKRLAAPDKSGNAEKPVTKGAGSISFSPTPEQILESMKNPFYPEKYEELMKSLQSKKPPGK
jgi:type IV secretory pathway TraG/TraD family ATPase VirD4